jgi:lipoprotein Spr
MTLKIYSIAFISLVAMSSCKSLSKISSRDGSSANTTIKKSSSGNPQFLNIEVNPGSTVTSKHKTSGIKKETVTYTNPDATVTNSNIESADFLQLKYSVLMDIPVEKLTNITLLQKMEEWRGTRYCMGGSTKACIDCSAFTTIMLRDVYGVILPRTAQEQYQQCERIDTDNLQEGDLVFFHTQGREISHVGVYLANNKFVHASTSGGVTITDLNDKYWHARYRGAGRVTKKSI